MPPKSWPKMLGTSGVTKGFLLGLCAAVKIYGGRKVMFLSSLRVISNKSFLRIVEGFLTVFISAMSICVKSNKITI